MYAAQELTFQWDTAGQERFRTITTAYYRGAMGILLVFDLTDEKSFNGMYNGCLQPRHPELVQGCRAARERGRAQDLGREQVRLGREACKYTASRPGADTQAVTTEQAQALADELGLTYVETSAKSNTNVDEAFFKLAQQVKDHLVDQGITSNVHGTPGTSGLAGQSGKGSFGVGGTSGKQGGCC